LDEVQDVTIGGKAKNLYRLKSLNLKVPQFVVIPAEVLYIDILKGNDVDAIVQLENFDFPPDWLSNIIDYFNEETFFAVRSSAIDEDGSEFSFAGQFDSFLYVTTKNLEVAIRKVWMSAFSKRVQDYRKNNNLKRSKGIAVIVQEMIPADVAGVAFGINPTNGNRDEKIISSVYGLGEGLVSGELDADTYIYSSKGIEKKLAKKTHEIRLDETSNTGTRLYKVQKEIQELSSLNEKQIEKLVKVLDQCYLEYGKPQDIEFAFINEDLFLLQARPITNLDKIQTQEGEYILWDNSNIIESYPGVTTPLTFSFISESYEGAYKLFSEYLGVEKSVINENENVFKNTLGLINGRVYYNLKTWYHMLAMVPGYSVNARFMEKMMGVKERFDIPEKYRLSKGKAWWRIIKMAFRMYGRFLALPKKRKAFMLLLENTIAEYKSLPLGEKNVNELMELYLNFEQKLLNEWKAPLLNDFFAMIWFGMLEKRCKKYGISDNPNIHNDLLCGSSDIISTQPIHRSIALATQINANAILKRLFLTKDENTIWNQLPSEDSEEGIALKKEIDRYIIDFGERCIGELKLETISYTQDPTKFIKVLKSYVETEVTASKTSGKIEEELRSNAERAINETLKYKPFKKRRLNRTLNKARVLVSSRENLRYERTRAFGIVRELFSNIGKRWYAESVIEDASDIFYLTKEEIFAFIQGRAVSQNIKELIALRRQEFSEYKKQDPPSERFASYGTVYHANDFFSQGKIEKLEGDLKGIGCCPGRVTAKVRVIHNPEEVNSLDGDILVTSSTDPGWVTLFPSASAIIVERGSLLSHSAIVSREMGIPCIVSVTGLLKTLNTGDVVEMDGSTGEIKIISTVK
jgi:pyruvate,water dikinase